MLINGELIARENDFRLFRIFGHAVAIAPQVAQDVPSSNRFSYLYMIISN